MPLNTLTLSARVYPTVVRTILTHYGRRIAHLGVRRPKSSPADMHQDSLHSSRKRSGYTKRQKRRHTSGSRLADEQLLYDLSLAIVRVFVNAMVNDTVESIQGFGNTTFPAPPHVRVQATHIPSPAIHKAADVLTNFFTDESGKLVDPLVGGARWWQVRPGPLPAEWVVPAQKVRHRAAEKGTRKRDRLRSLFRPHRPQPQPEAGHPAELAPAEPKPGPVNPVHVPSPTSVSNSSRPEQHEKLTEPDS